jgi:hypothetical protein
MPTQGQEFEVGLLAVFSGWGALSAATNKPDKLYSVELEIVSDVQCEQDYDNLGLGFFVPEAEICAGVDGPSACYVSPPSHGYLCRLWLLHTIMQNTCS